MNQVKLGEAEALFAVLRQSADADVVAAIEALVRDTPDPALNRVNVLDFAAKRGHLEAQGRQKPHGCGQYDPGHEDPDPEDERDGDHARSR